MNPLPGDVYAKIRSICHPFKAGERFRALPGVQFWVPGGKVNQLAPLLPDLDEPESDYLERLEARGIESFALRIVEPWADDPAWWSWMRERVQPIWQERGQPVLPVDTELIWSHRLVPHVAHGPDQESYAWVLTGKVDATEVPDVLRLHAGTDLPWVGAPSAVWLRMLVGTDGRRVVAEAAEAIAAELDAALETSATPYLPWADKDEVPQYRDIATRVAATVGEEQNQRRLMAHWLRRCSSSGLEPVPHPRPRDGAASSHAIFRRTTSVLHSIVGSELLCAANGHLFAVQNPSLSELLRQINSTTTVSTTELALHWPEPVVSALIDRLYRLRALEVVR